MKHHYVFVIATYEAEGRRGFVLHLAVSQCVDSNDLTARRR